MQITHAALVSRTTLCRTFCRHYAMLTGTGLAHGHPTPARLEKDGDNE